MPLAPSAVSSTATIRGLPPTESPRSLVNLHHLWHTSWGGVQYCEVIIISLSIHDTLTDKPSHPGISTPHGGGPRHCLSLPLCSFVLRSVSSSADRRASYWIPVLQTGLQARDSGLPASSLGGMGQFKEHCQAASVHHGTSLSQRIFPYSRSSCPHLAVVRPRGSFPVAVSSHQSDAQGREGGERLFGSHVSGSEVWLTGSEFSSCGGSPPTRGFCADQPPGNAFRHPSMLPPPILKGLLKMVPVFSFPMHKNY